MGKYDIEVNSYDKLYYEEQLLKHKYAEKKFDLDNASRVLDIGCGTGIFAERIAEKVEFVVGIDISIGMLSKAKSKLINKSNTHLINSDLDHLPLKRCVFNHVFAFSVLHDYSDLKKAIRELFSVLTPSSKVMISIMKKKTSQKKIEKIVSKMNLENIASLETSDTKDIFLIFENDLQSKRFNSSD